MGIPGRVRAPSNGWEFVLELFARESCRLSTCVGKAEDTTQADIYIYGSTEFLTYQLIVIGCIDLYFAIVFSPGLAWLGHGSRLRGARQGLDYRLLE